MVVEFQFGLILPSESAEIVDDPKEDQAEGAVQQELSQSQEPAEETPIRRAGRSFLRDTHRLYLTRSKYQIDK